MATDVFTLKNPAGTTVFNVDSDGTVTALAGFTYSGVDDFGSTGIKADVVAESTSAAGVTVDGTLIKDGGATLTDSTTFIADNGDTTKKLAFQVSGITTGTTRTWTVPDANVTMTVGGAALVGLTGAANKGVRFTAAGTAETVDNADAATAIGGSTAAAGTTTSDAGELPAGTARVYPTTGADDTKGVRIHTGDKVTGRTVFIGNGVANKILNVYPPSGGTINGGSADAAFSSASGKGVIAFCADSGTNTWYAW